jgi:hypothetical protein
MNAPKVPTLNAETLFLIARIELRSSNLCNQWPNEDNSALSQLILNLKVVSSKILQISFPTKVHTLLHTLTNLIKGSRAPIPAGGTSVNYRLSAPVQWRMPAYTGIQQLHNTVPVLPNPDRLPVLCVGLNDLSESRYSVSVICKTSFSHSLAE